MRKVGGHENIIRILYHGWLKGSLNVYIIDMELADLPMSDYINYLKGAKVYENLALQPSGPAFIRKECSPHRKMQNVWTIGFHIARGLDFMHLLGFVHRDLKPSNGTPCK